MAEDLAVKVENLRKSINGNEILKGINLKIHTGEKVCIVGGSGCGKTVLVKHFNYSNQPDSGRIIVLGKDLDEMSESQLDKIRKKVGYIYQNNVLFDSAIAGSVYENVSLPLRADPYDYPAKNEDEIEARVEQALKSVGLSREFFPRRKNELSGGQQKRVAIARGIITNPKIIIYDEPTVGLDPVTKTKIIDLIRELYQKNKNTTIVITHDYEMMRAIKDRMIFLSDGRVHKFEGNYDALISSEDELIQNVLATAQTRLAPEEKKDAPQPQSP
jgi:phospholipid/cholesterol/gamma-HCH transport system ATP-binding protein